MPFRLDARRSHLRPTDFLALHKDHENLYICDRVIRMGGNARGGFHFADLAKTVFIVKSAAAEMICLTRS
jgi:hypothetical protein